VGEEPGRSDSQHLFGALRRFVSALDASRAKAERTKKERERERERKGHNGGIVAERRRASSASPLRERPTTG